MKDIGFKYATQSGISIAMNDLRIPDEKAGRLEAADKEISEIEDQYEMGLITDDERYEHAIRIWRDTTEQVQDDIQKRLKEYGGVYIMAVSGAKGNISQISQMAGMRGLMSDPAGRIIDLPIRSSFREGLSWSTSLHARARARVSQTRRSVQPTVVTLLAVSSTWRRT